jgi:hypothetical protein
MVCLLSENGRTLRPGKASRPGGDKRGSSRARRDRKHHLLALWGDGNSCPCLYCGTALTFATVEADRIIAGDSYRRSNVIPACRACNVARLDKSIWSFAPNVARRLKRRGYLTSTV